MVKISHHKWHHFNKTSICATLFWDVLTGFLHSERHRYFLKGFTCHYHQQPFLDIVARIIV